MKCWQTKIVGELHEATLGTLGESSINPRATTFSNENYSNYVVEQNVIQAWWRPWARMTISFGTCPRVDGYTAASMLLLREEDHSRTVTI